MHDDGTFVPARGVTDSAPIAVALKNCLSQSSEVLFILSFQRVAGCTETKRKQLCVSARTVQDLLTAHLQFPSPATYL